MTFRQGISHCGGCLLILLAAIVTTRGVLVREPSIRRLLHLSHGSVGVTAARDEVEARLSRTSQCSWSLYEALLVFHHGSSSSITCAMVRVGRRYLDRGPCDVNLTISTAQSPRQACLDIPLVGSADNLRSVSQCYSHNLMMSTARDLMITHGALSHQGWPTGNASPKHTTVRAVSDSGSRFVFSLRTPARLRVHCHRKDERKQMRPGLNSSHEAMDCRCFTCVKSCTLIQCGMSFVLWHQHHLQDAENLVLSPP
ncbi:hypothetical protein M431DRAFT_268878 [Trichoderma harzianum CBS 226.95]|uniref:Uncharacterized protein n=1 Tax=Trichoderma harzianum CBS 226.95 TaxID=983964 RepID=A0A2T3ZYR7_TRIHA|nr:hypothetical protein M431DRAFT_268878 [Trichoderma harzianum CBS 226.95]PTB49918.1 hypothetical protein M431DRAFT_268878 [Trichoderma harzianum CBS 226.95]